MNETKRTKAVEPREGIDRCPCGAKYWDGSVCASCGERYRPIVVTVTTPQGISHVVWPGNSAYIGRVPEVGKALDAVAVDYGGSLYDAEPVALTGATMHRLVFEDLDPARDFIDAIRETWARFEIDEQV